MANEQDFKKLLETQKETNKQLALLRQQQMEIAKDPPDKFFEGEEFKATALHIASEKLSGMHDTDDEVKKLREEIKEDNKKEEKKDQLATKFREEVTNSASVFKGEVGKIVDGTDKNGRKFQNIITSNFKKE